ncbi:MAG: carboxypeptidase regulatory-like domain-containing protein [Chitinophagales bacterium]
MKLKFTLYTSLIFSFLYCQILFSQNTQTIRGKVIDVDTKQPLVGATVVIPDGNGELTQGTVSDIDGFFKIEKVAVGRQTLKCSYVGYKDWATDNIYVSSGKELVLEIELKEAFLQGGTFIVTDKKDKRKATNTSSLTSTRAFSVEDVQRYPGSINDPGRMAMSFAGVRQANQDNENAMVIRSNSPVGVQWRLEGTDIPNPNHFAHRGSSGGGISALSVNVLGNSDFSTGAFAAEYGNAFAGIVDMKFRKGNNEKQEFRIQAGVVGLDAMAEGPLSKKNGSSYVVNYRYSTLSVFSAMGIQITEPNRSNDFQDLSFNISLPTKGKSSFNLWGLGAYSVEKRYTIKDSTAWERYVDFSSYDFVTQLGLVGLTHTYLLDKKSVLKTTLSASSHQLTWHRDSLDNDFNENPYFDEKLLENRFSLATTYSRKIRNGLKLKAGMQATALNYDLFSEGWDTKAAVWRPTISGKGTTFLLRSYADLNYKPTRKLTLNGGLHLLYLSLNNSAMLEPRFAMKYELNAAQSLSLAYGLHSQIQPLGNYFITLTDDTTGDITSQPNMDLGLNKAHHVVLSYDHAFLANTRLKLETYYQHMFNIPVTTDPNGTYYALNGYDEFARPIALVNEGTADNYGLDVTIEKFFSNRFFFLVSGSVYNSTYLAQNGKRYNTRYNGLFNTSVMASKEFAFKNGNSLEVGGKFLYSGGRRYTPIDTLLSAAAYAEVEDDTQAYTEQISDYMRVDLRIAFRRNKPKYYWMLSLDVQNLTDKRNEQRQTYDPWLNELAWIYQAERIPALSFTIDF